MFICVESRAAFERRNMLSLLINRLTHRTPDTILFQNLDLTLRPGLQGIMGPNGSGKSTLLAIIAGSLKAEAGGVRSTGLMLWLPQIHHARDWPSVVGPSLWNLLEPWWDFESGRTDSELLSRLEPSWHWISKWTETASRWATHPRPWDLDVRTLSGGELQRLRLALVDLLPKDIILLDEPTLHLDLGARTCLQEMLDNFPGIMAVASHDHRLMEGAARILYLEGGRHTHYEGGFTAMHEEREAAELRIEESLALTIDQKAKEKRKAQRVRERQERRSHQADKSAPQQGLPQILLGARKRNAEKTSGRLQAAQDQRLASLQARESELRAQRILRVDLNFDLKASIAKSGHWLLDVRELHLDYEGRKLWAKPVTFALAQGETLWLKGANGTGKSSLLRALNSAQKHVPELQVWARDKIYLDQNLAHLDGGANLLQMWNESPSVYIEDESQRRTIAARFGLDAEKLNRRCSDLSGGERMRVALTLMSTQCHAPDLVLLDEPSNHLDLATQEALLASLKLLRVGIILVSHDLSFAEHLDIDHVIDLDAHR